MRIEKHLKIIEEKVDKLDKSSFAVAMYAAGFPVLMVGFSQMVDSIIRMNTYAYRDYFEFST